MEPVHTMEARSTATSKAEGRLKVDAGKIKRRKKLKKIINNSYARR